MMVRAMTHKDFEPMLDLCEKLWHESPNYKDHPFSRHRLAGIGESILAAPDKMCGFVAVNGSEMEGFFVGIIAPYFFSNEKIAMDLGLFVQTSLRGVGIASQLIHAYESWAWDHGVREIQLGISTGIHQGETLGMYKQLGYHESGVICKKSTQGGT